MEEKKMKLRKWWVLVIAIILLFIQAVYSETLNDRVFNSVAVSLSAGKGASFSAETESTCASIKVTRVRLYKKNGTVWVYTGELQVPSDEAVNDYYFYASYDYSNDIGTGEYRLLATFTADGYNRNKYSNAMTY